MCTAYSGSVKHSHRYITWRSHGKKLGVYATTAVGVAAVAMAFFGTAVAAADDYSGKTCADASKAISDAGKKAVVASRAGDTLSDDQCIVSHSQSAPWIKGNNFSPVTNYGAGLPELQRDRGERQGSRKLGGQPRGQSRHRRSAATGPVRRVWLVTPRLPRPAGTNAQ